MKAKLIYSSLLLLSFLAAIISCSKESISPKRVTLDLSDNSGCTDKFTLGRVLFYDQHLSQNNTLSCASCHKQQFAFSDNTAFSKGFDNQLTLRNSSPIQNVTQGGAVPQLFWDGRESSLTSMVLKPIVNHVEMGMSDHGALVNRIKNQGYYPDLFQSAFGEPEITAEKIADALAEFVGSINSGQTRLDKFNAGQSTLSPLEIQGRDLFFNKYDCNRCHQPNFPSAYGHSGGGEFANIGLDMEYSDNGRANFTHSPADNGKFKIPNLRNIVLTGPYMHDGRFATLGEVLEHYSQGIKDHPNLDPGLREMDGKPKQFNISPEEKNAIIAFLGSHTDSEMTSAKEFSDPFKVH